jgi:ketosteroid isomerase-like protein
MDRRIALAALAFTLIAAPPLGAAEPAPPAADAARERLVEEVRSAELAFAATVVEKRPDAFAEMVADDAVFLGARGEVARGRAEVVAAWQGLFAAGAPEFRWHPEIVELSGDGTLGLSRGPWTVRGRDPQGNAFERGGTFTSIWRRQADGSWRVIFDAGCGGCPDCG